MELSDEQKLALRIKQRFNKTCADYQLIADGDRILIGLSGGKDSLALLELMGERAKILKPRFEVVAAHVVMSNIPYRSDLEYLRKMAEKVGVELHVVETSFDASTDKRKTPCFLCSWNRRKALFELAKSLGCNKIALGHHMDDVLVTLLMNLCFQGEFGTMPPLLKMDKFNMQIIRPLCRIEEQDLEALAAIRGYKSQIKNCPYENDSHRINARRMLHEMVELNPEAKYSLWGAMSNVQNELLPPPLK